MHFLLRASGSRQWPLRNTFRYLFSSECVVSTVRDFLAMEFVDAPVLVFMDDPLRGHSGRRVFEFAFRLLLGLRRLSPPLLRLAPRSAYRRAHPNPRKRTDGPQVEP